MLKSLHYKDSPELAHIDLLPHSGRILADLV